jgi:phage terminase large subunit
MSERGRPQKGELRLELSIPRKHHEVLFSDKHHLCLCGGRGGAKSVSAASKIILEMCRGRKRVACFRQYQSNIRESAKELLERIIRDNDLSDQFKCTEQEIVHRLNGGQIFFIGLERNLDKVRALDDVDIFWIDEAQNVGAEAIDALIPTARKLGAQMVWTWNPTDPSDPVETTFRGPHPRDDMAIALVNWRDNPFFFQTTLPGEMDHQRRIDPAKAAHIWDDLHNQSFDAVVFNSRLSEGKLFVPGQCAAGLWDGFWIYDRSLGDRAGLSARRQDLRVQGNRRAWGVERARSGSFGQHSSRPRRTGDRRRRRSASD